MLLVPSATAGYNCSSIHLPAEPVGTLASGASGLCNAYLPNSSVLARFFWVVRFYARNGFTVVIVDHTEDGTVTSNYAGWLAVRTILTSQTPVSPSNDSRYMMNWFLYSYLHVVKE